MKNKLPDNREKMTARFIISMLVLALISLITMAYS